MEGVPMTLARVIPSDAYWREVDQLEHDGSTRHQARIDAAKEHPCPTPVSPVSPVSYEQWLIGSTRRQSPQTS